VVENKIILQWGNVNEKYTSQHRAADVTTEV